VCADKRLGRPVSGKWSVSKLALEMNALSPGDVLRYLLARSKDGPLAGIRCRKLRGSRINPDPQHQA